MRLVGRSQRGPECGPIAIYNLARILRLKGARGGYRANRDRLVRSTHYNVANGSRTINLWRAANRELRGSRYELVRRRPFWNNVLSQFLGTRHAAVGLLIWSVNPEENHIVLAWSPFERRTVILAANAAARHTFAPLYLQEGPIFWPTSVHPKVTTEDGRLHEFWQVVPS